MDGLSPNQFKAVHMNDIPIVEDLLTLNILDFFGIKHTSQQKLFKNLALFDFEPICVQEESFKGTKTTAWIEKHVPISVSISSNIVEGPIFLYNSDPLHLVSLAIGTLEGLASQSKAQMKLLLLDIQTTIKIRL